MEVVLIFEGAQFLFYLFDFAPASIRRIFVSDWSILHGIVTLKKVYFLLNNNFDIIESNCFISKVLNHHCRKNYDTRKNFCHCPIL